MNPIFGFEGRDRLRSPIDVEMVERRALNGGISQATGDRVKDLAVAKSVIDQVPVAQKSVSNPEAVIRKPIEKPIKAEKMGALEGFFANKERIGKALLITGLVLVLLSLICSGPFGAVLFGVGFVLAIIGLVLLMDVEKTRRLNKKPLTNQTQLSKIKVERQRHTASQKVRTEGSPLNRGTKYEAGEMSSSIQFEG